MFRQQHCIWSATNNDVETKNSENTKMARATRECVAGFWVFFWEKEIYAKIMNNPTTVLLLPLLQYAICDRDRAGKWK